jgi:hypothetical protein
VPLLTHLLRQSMRAAPLAECHSWSGCGQAAAGGGPGAPAAAAALTHTHATAGKKLEQASLTGGWGWSQRMAEQFKTIDSMSMTASAAAAVCI